MLRTVLCCFYFLLVLASVSSIKTLKDIKDLKKNVNFVKGFPHHGLMLLHWLANIVEIDKKGEIQFTFDPGQGSYGFHRCRNEIPDRNIKQRTPIQSESYYFLGDLSHGRARMLPFYVTQDFHNSKGSQQKNMDRILIKVLSKSPQRIERVLLTQNSQGTGFDLNNTYEINAQLLVQIQALCKDMECDTDDPRLEFRKCEFLDYQQKAAKLELVYPKVLGLAWFLTLAGYNSEQRSEEFVDVFCSTNNQNNDCNPLSMDDGNQCYVHNRMKLEVKSSSNGYARITWSGIPESIAKMEVSIGLYRDGTNKEPLEEYPLERRTFGSIDTNVPLNPGLQIRLVRSEKSSYNFFFSTTHYTSIWNGSEFDETNGVLPTKVNGYDMSLQLYTKDGYACARVHIKKSFANWRTVFDNSWVGFYANPLDGNNNYIKYEWVVNFEKGSGEHCPLDYDVYEHESSLDIGPGVQARLMLTRHSASEKARTVPWSSSTVS